MFVLFNPTGFVRMQFELNIDNEIMYAFIFVKCVYFSFLFGSKCTNWLPIFLSLDLVMSRFIQFSLNHC